jgi:hypothetical protein
VFGLIYGTPKVFPGMADMRFIFGPQKCPETTISDRLLWAKGYPRTSRDAPLNRVFIDPNMIPWWWHLDNFWANLRQFGHKFGVCFDCRSSIFL